LKWDVDIGPIKAQGFVGHSQVVTRFSCERDTTFPTMGTNLGLLIAGNALFSRFFGQEGV
jgi:hypothetical protein